VPPSSSNVQHFTWDTPVVKVNQVAGHRWDTRAGTSQSTGDGKFDLLYHFGQKGSWFPVGVPDGTSQGASKCGLHALPVVSSLSRVLSQCLVDHAVVAKTLAQNCPHRPKRAGSVCATLS
jgi:hypothetical protein